jgi:glycosyltransferase involved in cell wall biosynthesis
VLLNNLRVAIVHDWFMMMSGGEACVEQFLELFPQADVFCLVDFLPEEQRSMLNGRKVTTSFIQRLPWARKAHRAYLPLMPIAIEQFDLSGYDLVLSASAAMSKGVITGPDQVHISYTFTPVRYAWDLQHVYLRESNSNRGLKGLIARAVLHYIRIWDARTGSGVDQYIAISEFIARRIRKAYRREAKVIYPPVNTGRFAVATGPRDDFYFTASRMVPYKSIPMIVKAFERMPDRRLIVIGDGPDMALARKAAGPNVTLLGYQPNDVLVDHMQRAKAFIFAAEEDFGIAPIEAQACGTPVIAFGRGGALETIVGRDGEGQTGIFFDEQSPDAIASAVRRFEEHGSAISSDACRANAERFAIDRFRREILDCVEAVLLDSDIPHLAAKLTPRDGADEASLLANVEAL